jgi:hypothetical protein
VAAAVAAAVACGTAPARAASCADTDLRLTFPPDGAENVATDALPQALYSVNSEYLDEPVVFEHVGGKREELIADYEKNEHILKIVPAEPLAAGDEYVIEWPGLRGYGNAQKGAGKTVRFEVGAGPDQASPEFDGLIGVDWDIDREHDDCADSRVERNVFTLALAPADDDGGRDSLQLVVYQTRGPELAPGVRKPLPVMPLPPPDEDAELRIDIDGSAGDVCFAALVRDLSGKVSSGASHEVCTRTRRPPFFYGCSTPAAAPHGGASLAALLLLASLGRRRT